MKRKSRGCVFVLAVWLLGLADCWVQNKGLLLLPGEYYSPVSVFLIQPNMHTRLLVPNEERDEEGRCKV